MRPLERGDRAAQRTLLALLQPSAGGIMWRTAKSSVAHELGIPQQTSSVQRLALSAVERHAYRRCEFFLCAFGTAPFFYKLLTNVLRTDSQAAQSA